MPQNFIKCDREQVLLMPPSLRDWLPENHLAWTILASVQEMDLSAFYGAYHADGHGRRAYEPAMMVGFCSTRTPAGTALRARSSGRVWRMWPIV